MDWKNTRKLLRRFLRFSPLSLDSFHVAGARLGQFIWTYRGEYSSEHILAPLELLPVLANPATRHWTTELFPWLLIAFFQLSIAPCIAHCP